MRHNCITKSIYESKTNVLVVGVSVNIMSEGSGEDRKSMSLSMLFVSMTEGVGVRFAGSDVVHLSLCVALLLLLLC